MTTEGSDKLTNQELSSRFLSCLDIEKQEDIDQTTLLIQQSSPKVLSSCGIAILNLAVNVLRTGIGGKLIVELGLHSSIGGGSGSGKKSSRNSRGGGGGSSVSRIEVGDFKVGDIVKIDKYSNMDNSKNAKKLKNSSKKLDQEDAKAENIAIDCVITSVSDKQINLSVSCDLNTVEGAKVEEKLQSLYENDVKVWIVKVSNVITYNRMESTMRKLSELNVDNSNEIIKLLLGESQFSEPGFKKLLDTRNELIWSNNNLNPSQKDAVASSMISNLTVVHGPPGTGKTSTLIELIKQLITEKRKTGNTKRILICGASNISIDTILERLSSWYNNSNYQKLIRIGHPARLLPSILKHSLDLITENESGNILKEILKEINSLTKNTKKTKSYRERREMYTEIKELRKDLRFRSRKATSDTIIGSEVVLATLHGSSARELVQAIKDHGDLFDTLIIDEVSQALEPACWIPLIYHQGSLNKLIIAGDNMQLSPTIKTKSNQKVINTLSSTLFDRLLKVHSKNSHQFIKFLNIQYRMNEKIMRFPSDSLYDGLLTAHESVKFRKVCHLPYVNDKAKDDAVEEIIWFDTQGDDFPEMNSGELSTGGVDALTSSKYNDGECLIVLKHIKSLVNLGVKESDIGVISPYSAQVSKLRKLLREGVLHDDDEDDGEVINESLFKDVEISTVDGFQGREKEIIILSLVRSNDDRDVGFLSDFKRLNVSITRSMKQLCIVGNFETLSESGVGYLKNWCDWCEENADLRYVNIGELYE